MSELSEESRYLPFGAISTATAVAAHPYHPAEQVSVEVLDRYYIRQESHKGNLHRVGWRNLEQGLSSHDDSYLEQAEIDFTAVCTNDRLRVNTEVRHSAELGRACMPAFHDRLAYGHPTPITAAAVYGNLVQLLASTRDDGDRAEIILFALGARMAQERPEDFIYPSGPREGTAELRNDEGKTYNHDGYTLDEAKIPIETKLHGRVTRHLGNYDPHTFIFQLLTFVRDAHHDASKPSLPPAGAARNLINQIQTRLTEEVTAGIDHSDYLGPIENHLRANMAEHKRLHPMDGRFTRSPSTLPLLEAEVSGMPSAGGMASIGEVALHVRAAVEGISGEEIEAVLNILGGAHHALTSLSGESSQRVQALADALGHLPTHNLEAALAALATARESLRLYLEDATGASTNNGPSSAS